MCGAMKWGCSNQIHSPNSNNWPNKSQQRNSSLLKTRTTTRQLKPNIRIQWLNITCYFTNSGIILIQRHPLIGWWLPARTRNGSLCAMTRPESISISLCVCVCVCLLVPICSHLNQRPVLIWVLFVACVRKTCRLFVFTHENSLPFSHSFRTCRH